MTGRRAKKRPGGGVRIKNVNGASVHGSRIGSLRPPASHAVARVPEQLARRHRPETVAEVLKLADQPAELLTLVLPAKALHQLETRGGKLTPLIERDRVERARIVERGPCWRVGLGSLEERWRFAFAEDNVHSQRRTTPEGVTDSSRGSCHSGADPEIPQPIVDQPGRGRRDVSRTAVRKNENERVLHQGFLPQHLERAGGVLKNLTLTSVVLGKWGRARAASASGDYPPRST